MQDSNVMNQLFAAALGADNERRNQAESMMGQQLAADPNGFIYGVLKALRTSTDAQVRSLCAIHLRRQLVNGEPMIFEKLSENLQKTVKSELLQAITQEPERYVRSQICDTVGSLAMAILHEPRCWPDFFPFLWNCAGGQSVELLVSSITILGNLADATDCILPHLKQICEITTSSLSHSNIKVRTAAVQALAKVVVCVAESEGLNLKQLRQFVPAMLKVMLDLLNEGEELSALDVLRSFVDLATDEPHFFRPHLGALAEAMWRVGNSKLDEGLRTLAVATMGAVCQEAPGMVRKSPDFVKTSLELCMSLMLNMEDDEGGAWAQEAEDDNRIFECGEMTMTFIGQTVGGKTIVPIAYPLISDFVSKSDWKFRYAGLIALAQVGDIFPYQQLPIPQVVQFLKDPHPRVRYAAVNCLGELAMSFEEMHEIHQMFFTQLMGPLTESAYPRLQTHAGAALFNFIENCPAEVMAPYVEHLLKVFLDLLKNGKQIVKEQCLTTIAAIAGSAPEQFPQYYNHIVPLVKQIIIDAHGPEVRQLRARAMECITFIGMAVGADRFRDDAKDVMRIFIELMKNGSAADDISNQYMLQAWTRICSILKLEFIPYLSMVMPTVFATIRKKEKPDITLLEDEVQFKYRSSLQEEKGIACSMICSFLNDLGEGYFPYLRETVTLMVPLMSFIGNEDIRSYAISSMGDIMKCCVASCKSGKVDVASVRVLFLEVSGSLLKCFKIETDMDLLMTLVGALQQCCVNTGDLAKQCLNRNDLKLVGDALLQLLLKSHKRISVREERRKKEDFDEEAEMQLMVENEAEDELNFMVAECIGTMMKLHKEDFLPTFDQLVPEILRMLDAKSTAGARKIAIFIFDDVVEHIGEPSGRYFSHFLPGLFQQILDKRCEIRQASAYGISVCCKHAPQAFKPYISNARDALLRALKITGGEEEESARDNVVVAVGNLACSYNMPDILVPWLQSLPLKQDVGEGPAIYTRLCDLVESNNQHVMGQNMANLPKILSVLIRVFGTDWVMLPGAENPEMLNQRIHKLIQQIKSMNNSEKIAQESVRHLGDQEQVEKLTQVWKSL